MSDLDARVAALERCVALAGPVTREAFCQDIGEIRTRLSALERGAAGAASDPVPEKADPDMMVWECRVMARRARINVPDGGDFPMRMAVRDAFKEVTGVDDEYCFSGWNAPLSDGQRAVAKLLPPAAGAAKARYYVDNDGEDDSSEWRVHDRGGPAPYQAIARCTYWTDSARNRADAERVAAALEAMEGT